MPAVIPAIGAAFSAVSTFAASSALAGFLVNTVSSIAMSALATAIRGKPEVRQPGITTTTTTAQNSTDARTTHDVIGFELNAAGIGSAWSGGAANRMNRIWRVQNTGSVGAVSVALPNSLVSTAPTMLVSTSADFLTGVTPVLMTASGSFWTASAPPAAPKPISSERREGEAGSSVLFSATGCGALIFFPVTVCHKALNGHPMLI